MGELGEGGGGCGTEDAFSHGTIGFIGVRLLIIGEKGTDYRERGADNRERVLMIG
jgi:hypothetical protein